MNEVSFIYCDNGEIEKQFTAMCSAIPRVGEFVLPNAGSSEVIVHAVMYHPYQDPDTGITLTPVVFLRDLTNDESKRLGVIKKRPPTPDSEK